MNSALERKVEQILQALLLTNGGNQNQSNILIHAIFGTLPAFDAPNDPAAPTLSPPSRFARRIPLYTPPSKSSFTALLTRMLFHKRGKWAMDPVHQEQNALVREEEGGRSPTWAAWFKFTDAGETITPSALAFLVDIFTNLPVLLPREERPGLKTRYVYRVVLMLP